MPEGRSTRSNAEEETLICKVVEKILNSETFIENLVAKIYVKLEQRLDEKLKVYEEKVGLLEIQLKEAKKEALDSKDNLEQYTRRNSLRIFGVPEKRGENTDDIVRKLCKEKLDLDISVTAIDCSHRLPAKETQHRPIIVKLVSRNTKNLIFNHKRLLKGTKIVIKEDLTKRRAQLLRDAAKKLGPTNAWTYEGNIVVKVNNKIQRISSYADLANINIVV
jgi:hypothetical protein